MKFEPNADARTLAKDLRNLYMALVQEGFTSDEALRFLAITIGTAQQPGSANNGQ